MLPNALPDPPDPCAAAHLIKSYYFIGTPNSTVQRTGASDSYKKLYCELGNMSLTIPSQSTSLAGPADAVKELVAQCAGGFTAAGTQVIVKLASVDREECFYVESKDPADGPNEIMKQIKVLWEMDPSTDLSVLVYALVGGFDTAYSK